jgi:hypothetical protein
MAEEKSIRETIKGYLEWLHHLYWIWEFASSFGAAGVIMAWLKGHISPDFFWPIGLLLFGSILFLVDFFRRRTSPAKQQSGIQKARLALGPTVPPGQFDAKGFFRRAYYSQTLQEEAERNFRAAADEFSPEDKEAFYLKVLGLGALGYSFDSTWWPLYRSQLEALLELNRAGGMAPLSMLKRHYETASKQYATEYNDKTFDAWVEYMAVNKLWLVHPSEMVEIGLHGREFLKYLVHFGKTPDMKRL